MITTWSKFRSLLRRPMPLMGEVPATLAPAPSPPAPIERTRIEPDALLELRTTLKQIEAELAQTTSRHAELAAAFQTVRERDATRSETVDLKPLRADIQTLSQVQGDLAAKVKQIIDVQATLSSTVTEEQAELTALEAKQRTLEERINDNATRARDAQLSAESAQETFRALRQDLEARDLRRDREMNGRLAGLYIVGFVALFAALATLVLYLTQQRVG